MEENLKDLFNSKALEEGNLINDLKQNSNLSIELENSDNENNLDQSIENDKQEEEVKENNLEKTIESEKNQNSINNSQNEDLKNQNALNKEEEEQISEINEQKHSTQSAKNLNQSQFSFADNKENNEFEQYSLENSQYNEKSQHDLENDQQIILSSNENKQKNISEEQELEISNKESFEQKKDIIIKEQISINQNYVESVNLQQSSIESSKQQNQQFQEDYDFSLNDKEEQLQNIEIEEAKSLENQKQQQTGPIPAITEEMFEKYDIDDDDDFSDAINQINQQNPSKPDEAEFYSLNLNQQNKNKQVFASQNVEINQEINQFVLGRKIVIQDFESKKDWLIFEKRIYKLQTFKLINNEKTEIMETDRGYRDFC